jgi:hypothetical protein
MSRLARSQCDQVIHNAGERGGRGSAISSKRLTSGTVMSARKGSRPPFSLVLEPDGSEPSMGHHGKRDMSIPTMPVANLIVVEAGDAADPTDHTREFYSFKNMRE